MSKLAIPNIRPLQPHSLNRSTTAATFPGLQGSLVPGSTGGAVTNGTTYREVVVVAGASSITVRLKTTTATGSVTITPIRLVGANPNDEAVVLAGGVVDPTKVQKYGTGSGTGTVVAGTELATVLSLAGEAYVLVEFACTLTGTLNYCDVSTLSGGGSSGGGGGGGGGGAVTVVDGGDIAQGSTTDAPATAPTTTAPLTLLGLFKGALNYLKNIADNTSAATSNTIVPVQLVDDTNTFKMPLGNIDTNSLFTFTSGKVADGATAAGYNSVPVGSPDSGGTMRTPQSNLASATPVSTADYGFTVNANLRGLSSANTLRALTTATGFTGGGSGAATLMVAEARASTATASAYEQVFNNLNVSLLGTLARTAKPTSVDQTNFNHRGIKITIDVTAGTSPSLVVTLDGKDAASGKYYNILTSAAITTVSTVTLTVFPGATAVGGLAASDILSRLFRIEVTPGNGNSITYSVGYSLVV